MNITAIIPCSDATWLADTIRSLKEQTSRPDEVLVVADGIEIGDIEGARIVGNSTNLGKSRSINEAVSIAQNPIILCIDADTELAPEGLEIMAKYLIDEIKIVVPSINPKKKATWIEKGRAELYERVNRLGYGFGMIGCCFLSTKEYLLAHPFSSDTLTEDQDYVEEMRKRGDRAFHSFRANCFTVEPESVSSLIKQESRWYYGFLQVQRKHHHRAFIGFLIMFVGYPVAVIGEQFLSKEILGYVVFALFLSGIALIGSDEIGGLHEALMMIATTLGEIRTAILFLLRRKVKW